MQQVFFQEIEFFNLVIDYDYKVEIENFCLDIVYGIDKNFLFGCGISIVLILKYNEGSRLCFYIFIDYFGDDDRKYFDVLALQYKIRIKIYLINGDRLRLLFSIKNWIYVIYFRFVIVDYFINKAFKVFYLDVDIICQGIIELLINFLFFDDKVVMVVIEG